MIPDPSDYSFMTFKERDRMNRLRRRALHLKGRIAASSTERSWDRAELSALEWAMGQIISTYWETEDAPAQM